MGEDGEELEGKSSSWLYLTGKPSMSRSVFGLGAEVNRLALGTPEIHVILNARVGSVLITFCIYRDATYRMKPHIDVTQIHIKSLEYIHSWRQGLYLTSHVLSFPTPS